MVLIRESQWCHLKMIIFIEWECEKEEKGRKNEIRRMDGQMRGKSGDWTIEEKWEGWNLCVKNSKLWVWGVPLVRQTFRVDKTLISVIWMGIWCDLSRINNNFLIAIYWLLRGSLHPPLSVAPIPPLHNLFYNIAC